MPAEPAFVIIGASLAGAKAAETLREEGFTGSIVLIGAEQVRPYERPPLSKGVLLGNDDESSVFVHDENWYSEHDVDLRLGVEATAIDRGARQVRLSDGTSVSYDKLLITTGASPRKLKLPPLGGVHYLRSLEDARLLRETLKAGGQVVIAGSGWIGLETAAAAREYGCEVTVVEPEPGPLHRSIGPELGEVFRRLHASHGVTFRFGEGVAELVGGQGDGGKVTAVRTTSGAELPASLVIVGIGAVPNSQLAADAGLDVDNGILTDDAMRTSDPDIYAAGDVANSFNPLLGRRLRVEHWGNALAGGPAAAKSMLGQEVSYALVPYQRPVRPRHGSGRPVRAGPLRRGGLPRRPGLAGVHRLLALRRRRDRRDERQRLGRQRRHPGPDPLRPPHRPVPPRRPHHPPHRPLTPVPPAPAHATAAGDFP
jgi:NADPH-dependent 2,4-dienoyl-CoA reductase/sulfur reductase-like enzyme